MVQTTIKRTINKQPYQPIPTTLKTRTVYTPINYNGYYSILNQNVNGTGLSINYNSALDLSSGDFTIECWIYLNSLPVASNKYTVDSSSPGGPQTIWRCDSPSVSSRLAIFTDYIAFTQTTWNTDFLYTLHNFSINTWYHIAITRNGNNYYLFINGTQKATNTSSSGLVTGSTGWGIGCAYSSVSTYAFLNGYISNFRILKGTGLYTTGFQVPTTPLTAISNTSLLTCQSNNFQDNSGNNLPIISTGQTIIQKNSPFPSPNQIYNWRCPDTVYWMKASVIGAGGSGGYNTTNGGAGGGGAGGFFQGYFKTVPGQTYSLTVGCGGAGNGSNGGDSSISNIGTAKGGAAGSSIITGGTGGQCLGPDGTLSTLKAQSYYTGGSGGIGSSAYTYCGAGGGGGIGGANGAAGIDNSTYTACVGGSGAGSFGGDAGASVIGASNNMSSGGGGGIGYDGGTAQYLSAIYGGGGASINGRGGDGHMGGIGGMDYDGYAAIHTDATYLGNARPGFAGTYPTISFAGGGGGAAGTSGNQNKTGAGFLLAMNSIIDQGIPVTANQFYSVFGTLSGAAGGVTINSAVNYPGTNSMCGGGTGAVSTTGSTGAKGGHSFVCGGGGGAAGNSTTNSIGGNGAGGGGGGGGAVGGNGGDGLIIIEY